MNKKKTMIYLVRHGQTEWNATERIQGNAPIPLNDKGRHQATHIAKHLKNISVHTIYTSPLIRARETATIIAAHHPQAVFVEIPELKERSFGDLEGKSHTELNSIHPALIWDQSWHYPDFRPPNGESLNDNHARLLHFAQKITSSHAGETIIVVSHAGTLRLLIGILADIPMKHLGNLHMENASLTLLEHSIDHGISVQVVNYTPSEDI